MGSSTDELATTTGNRRKPEQGSIHTQPWTIGKLTGTTDGSTVAALTKEPGDEEKEGGEQRESIQYKKEKWETTPMRARGKIHGQQVDMLVDTGAAISVMSAEGFEKLQRKKRIRLVNHKRQLHTAGQEQLESLGEVTVKVELGGQRCHTRFQVVTQLNTHYIVGEQHITRTTDQYQLQKPK